MGNIGKRLAGEQKSKTKGKLTRQQIVLIVIVAVLAVALAAAAAVRSLFVRPELPQNDLQSTADADGDGVPDGPEAIDWGEGIRPRAGGERKSEDFYTVLILGRDTGGGGNTDTMLLAGYDVTNQKATVMSIPRDTMVNVPWDVKRINSVYNYYGGGERGIQYLYKEISQLVGFEPDYQVVVEWEAVGKIVDAMGGVYFDVPRDMNYRDPYQDLVIRQTKGYRLLTGDDAMQVLRYRHDNNMRIGYPDGDLGRIKTQQALLKAVVEQLLKLENVTKVNEFIRVFKENVETDLSFQNILWFAKSAYTGGLKVDNVNFVTMPNVAKWVYSRSVSRQEGKYQEQSYVVPIARELLELVNNELSPFKEVFTMRDLDIMSVNADGSVSSSTGHVEDTQATNTKAYWKSQWEPEEEDPVVDENGNPIDPETGEPIVVVPEDGENGEEGAGTAGSGGTGTLGGTGQSGGSGTGASAPEPNPPSTGPEALPQEPAPETPPETLPDPQFPEDTGFTFIEPPPEA